MITIANEGGKTMMAIILAVIITATLVIMLLLAYLDLRSTVEIMKSTIKFQNERYDKCLNGWSKAIDLVDEVISLNEHLGKVNEQLLEKLKGFEGESNDDCK